MSLILGLLTNKYVLIVVGALLLAGVTYWWIWHDATQAALAAAAATALQRTAAAAKARSEVKSNDREAMNRDPHNRDLRP